jgi:type I restriction enzyme S subunit
MKAGWKTVKLGEACKIVNGATPSTSVEANWGGPHCWITPAEMGGLSDPYVSKTRRTLTDAGLADCSASLLPTGSVILSSRAPIGHVIINTVPMATNQGCKSMIPRSDLDAKFLFYFIKANVPLLESLGTGATFKELSGGKLASVEIPLPPLAEQKRIVALLDEAFAGIDEAKAKAELSIKRNADLFKSLLQSSFANQDPEWVEMTLENCCEQIFAGGDVPKDRLSDDRTKEFNVPIYANGEKDEGLYGFTDIARVTKPSITVSARGTLGFTAIRTEPFFPIVRLIVLVPDDEKITLSFLYHAISGMDFGNTGTSIPQLTVPNFKESKLRLPDLQTQNAVTGKIDSIKEKGESLRRLHEQKLSMLKELKNSLLAQAFAGELAA